MQKILLQMLSLQRFYKLTSLWLKYVSSLAAILLITGMLWGLFFVPPDYQQGDAFRIIYIHVPAAFLSLGIYCVMGGTAVLLLVWRLKLAGILMGVLAQIGAIITLLALLTGSIWGKPMWGTWWVWDARLTSEFILLFLYLSLLAIKNSFPNKDQGEKIMAILTLIGIIDLPIIHYSVYWWNSLHQGATLSLLAKPKIATIMLYPLLCTLLGFALYIIWLTLHKTRQEILMREYKQEWVKKLFLINANE